MNQTTIYKELLNLKNSDFYPFHMPGHKRNKGLAEKMGLWKEGGNPYEIDITEIPGFDDKQAAEGILLRAEKLAAEVYGAKKTFLSVNGSTGAILAGIGGVTRKGDYVLVARNCHKSVYHAIELFELSPVYLQGEVEELEIYREIKTTEVEETLKKAKEEGKRIALTILTSPTYEGIVSDIGKMAEICHFHGSLLMVDEAHGSHFGISKSGFFPETAVRLGADIVIQSLHKTMPSFTQTALLHLSKTTIVEKVRRKMNLLETSSPSYLLMAGIENCLNMIQKEGEGLFSAYEKRLNVFYGQGKGLQRVFLWTPAGERDKGKIVISAGEGSGSFLYEYFYEECHLVMEMKSKDYVIAMTSIFDTEEGFRRLTEALFFLEERLRKLDNKGKIDYTFQKGRFSLPERKFTPAETRDYLEKYGSERIDRLEEAEGRISADYVYFYPPGIPIVVAGEVVDCFVIERIREGKKSGITIYGGSDGNGIFVCADGEEFDRKG